MEISFAITRDIYMDNKDVKCLATDLETTLNEYIENNFDYPEGIYSSARKHIFRDVVEWMLNSGEYKFDEV